MNVKNSSDTRAISSIYILNSSCQILLSRDWRGETSSSCLRELLNTFKRHIESGINSPVVSIDDSQFALYFVCHRDIYIACVAKRATDIAVIFVFLHKLIALFTTYFSTFVEESIRDNFVLIYELLDEVVDNGYPQITEPGILKEFIKINAHCFQILQPPLAVTNSVSWRAEGILYKKNEIFLDVIECCSLAVDATGNETHSSIIGTARVRSQLSGMPLCELSLNERAIPTRIENLSGSGLEDVKFHACVDLNTYESRKVVYFTPPDGGFDLMTYRVSGCTKALVHIDATTFLVNQSTVNYTVHLSTCFKDHTTATSIQVEIPVQSDVTSPEIQCNVGTVVYVPEKDVLLWSLRNVKGNRRFKLKCKLALPSTRASTTSSKVSNIPVRVNFEIPYHAASGLQVKYLKVMAKEGYRALPWVRYITRTNDYEFRMTR